MKHIFAIIVVVFLLGCGSNRFGKLTGTTPGLQLPKFNNVQEALVFLRTHPAVTTTGIPCDLLIDNLNLSRNMLSRYISDDSYLTKKKLQVAGKAMQLIFAIGTTPREQVETSLQSLDIEMLKAGGVPMTVVENKLKYKQDGWSSKELRRSLSRYIDKEKYVIHRMSEKKEEEKYIFLNGYEPPKQIARYLDSLDQETLEQGVSITEIAANVSFPPGSWSNKAIYYAISYYIDEDKYITSKVTVGGVSDTEFFPKGNSPAEQINKYLTSLHPVIVNIGVSLDQIAAALSYTNNLPSVSSNKSIGMYLDREAYVTRKINKGRDTMIFVFTKEGFKPGELKAGIPIDKENAKLMKNLAAIGDYLNRLGYTRQYVMGGDYEEFIFAHSTTPGQQINGYLASLDPAKLKQGVSVKEVANNIVKYGREDWPYEDFLESISLYLDRDKYVTRFIIVAGEVDTVFFAKDFPPREQLFSYLQSLDEELLKTEGIPLTQVGKNVGYRQARQSDEEFFRSIRWHVRRMDGYVVRSIKRGRDGEEERREFRIFIQ